jgi:hypothetical protein
VRTIALASSLFLVVLGGASASGQPTPFTIRSSQPVVVYGKQVRISGLLRGRPDAARVTIYVRRYGRSAFSPVRVVDIGTRGTWSFSFEPIARSWIQARSGVVTSPTVTVRVTPRLTLMRRGGNLFARAVAARSFRGRHVWLQQRSRGVWRSVRRVVLHDPPRRFHVPLPRGVSRFRVALPRAQAGPGYEPTVSRPVLLRR